MMEPHAVKSVVRAPSSVPGSPISRLAHLLFLGCFLMTFFFPTIAGAGDVSGGLPQGDMGAATIKMLGALLLVLGIIIGLFYLAKRLRWGRLSFNRYPAMRMIGTLSLAPKRSVAMVEVCGQWLVLGVGSETVTLLCRLDNPPVLESSGKLESGNSSGFQSLLRKKIWSKSSTQGETGEINEKSC
jgi:flagellar biosynthetic protein FliO